MTFIHAAFLAAGLAVAVPWLLHLTRRRKYLRIRLGSLQFLDPIVRDRRRMSRVEQWPLLVARCLAVLLLALVFARPFFPKPAPAPPAAGEVLILLDASGSITPAQADIIREQASKAIASLPPATRPVIATVSDQVEILDSPDAYRVIPGSPGNFAKAVDWVVDRAASAPDSIAGVHWFTDLQRASLPAAPSRLWPSGLAVEVHPVLPKSTRNVAVEQIELLTPFGDDHWEIEARVRVHGMPGDTPLKLFLTTADNQTVTATLPPAGGVARLAWDGEAKDGILSGNVAITAADDLWPADDKRPFAFPTTRPKRIALVDGDPGDSPFLSETYFLEKALHASAAGKPLSPFRATVSSGIPAEGEDVDAIALCNLHGLTSSNVRLLRSHLDRGTGVALFLGDLTVPTAWSAAVAEGMFPSGLRAFAEPEPAFMKPAELNHPGLGGLTVESARGLSLVALTKRFTWPTDAAWTTAMAFDDGSPLAAFSQKFKLAVIAHPVNREGSNLPLDPSFVPFIQGLFGYLSQPTAGDTKASPLTATHPGHDEIREPGIYENDSGITVVSADLTESDVTSAKEKSFRELLGLPARDATANEERSIPREAATDHLREGEVWPWLVAVLLALLTVESVLAARRIHQPSTPEAHVQ